MTKKTVAMLVALLPTLAMAAPSVGEKPKTVVLDKDHGGRVSGGGWSSDEMKGKVHVLFYVDPDASDLNNAASEALKAEKFPRETYQSVAVINMAATWLPNFAIDSKLKGKQKDYPDTIYVRDLHKLLVNEWKVADDNNDVLVFDKDGKLRFIHQGKLDDAAIKKLIATIKQHM